MSSLFLFPRPSNQKFINLFDLFKGPAFDFIDFSLLFLFSISLFSIFIIIHFLILALGFICFFLVRVS